MSPLHNRHWKKPKYVDLYESKGKIYSYYRRGGQKFRIDGEPGTAAWVASYEGIHTRYEKGDERAAPSPGTVDAMIIAYRQSGRYRVLAQSTKDRYEFALTKLSSILGKHPIANVTRRVVVRLQDQIAKNYARSAIEVVKVLNLVCQCAMDLGEISANPAEGVRKPAEYRAKQHEAWTEEQITMFLAEASPVWRRAVIVALYTGLRRGDLVRLSRGHIKNGRIRIEISKTGGQTVIPIHSALQDELDRPMPAASLMLIPTARGKQMRPDSLTHGVQKVWKSIGVENGPPVHGLRRSAIVRLLRAGCTVEEVKAITGQAKRMVEYYAGSMHAEAMADSAVIKLERKD